jgi:hypothetical protein
MLFRPRNIRAIASMVVGDADHFQYRSSFYITEFMHECDLPFEHHGEHRPVWAAEKLSELLLDPQPAANALPDRFVNLLRVLMDKRDAVDGDAGRENALAALNEPLSREGFQAFYGDDDILYVRHAATKQVSAKPNPHKAFTPAELKRREQLNAYLNACSEDELIEEVLMPMMRQVGYHRITTTGHKDKSLEHGKDGWMRYTLPSQHMLYFGMQAKKGKLDANADSSIRTGANHNIAVIHNQVLMMLDSVIFDPEFNSNRLVDHAFIVAGGEITKSARKWLGDNLSASQRSRIMFMDRTDILNLFIASNTQLPAGAIAEERKPSWPNDLDDDVPF